LSSANGGVTVLDVEIKSTLGLIRGQVKKSTGPMRLGDLVPAAFELTDILVERANRLG